VDCIDSSRACAVPSPSESEHDESIAEGEVARRLKSGSSFLNAYGYEARREYAYA
jgi:hypothetical protein